MAILDMLSYYCVKINLLFNNSSKMHFNIFFSFPICLGHFDINDSQVLCQKIVKFENSSLNPNTNVVFIHTYHSPQFILLLSKSESFKSVTLQKMNSSTDTSQCF